MIGTAMAKTLWEVMSAPPLRTVAASAGIRPSAASGIHHESGSAIVREEEFGSDVRDHHSDAREQDGFDGILRKAGGLRDGRDAGAPCVINGVSDASGSTGLDP